MSSSHSTQVEQATSTDLSHHLSREARERLPNAMKTFFRSLQNMPELTSLANGKPIDLPITPISPSSTLSGKVLFVGQKNTGSLHLSTLSDLMCVLGDPHPTLYPLARVDFHVPAVSTLGSVSSWLDRSSLTTILSAFNGAGPSTIDLAVAMQYGTGLGIDTLREQFSKLNELLHAPKLTTRNVILTLGNADAMTKLYRLLGTPGDTFLVEEYSFCGLTNAPIAQGVKWQPVKVDDLGLIPLDMETILSTWNESARGRRPHVLYCIPTGQNPTSTTLPLERRREIYAIAQKYDVVILEDDPYYFFQYDTDVLSVSRRPKADVTADGISNFLEGLVPSFLSLDVDGRVVRIDTVSKTIAPNMRLGWITSNPLFSRKLEILTDNSTQHPHGLGQSLMAEILAPTGWGLDGYLRWVWGLRNEYERRRNFFFEIFQREVGQYGLASTKLPIAGMFFWIKIHVACHPRFAQADPIPHLGPKTNTRELLDDLFKSCFDHGLLVMPGVLFAMQPTDGSVAERASSEDHIFDRPYFRATFVGTDETIERALRIFGRVLKLFFTS